MYPFKDKVSDLKIKTSLKIILVSPLISALLGNTSATTAWK